MKQNTVCPFHSMKQNIVCPFHSMKQNTVHETKHCPLHPMKTKHCPFHSMKTKHYPFHSMKQNTVCPFHSMYQVCSICNHNERRPGHLRDLVDDDHQALSLKTVAERHLDAPNAKLPRLIHTGVEKEE